MTRERMLQRWSLPDVVAAAALALVVPMLLAYLCVFYQPLFNSDDAVVNILADAMHAQGRLLPHDWINNNGDLMMPSGALLVALLLNWFPNSYALHAAVSVLAAVLMLGSFGWLLRELQMPRIAVLVLMTFLGAGVSFDFSVMVMAQTTYFWWAAGFCACAALVVARHGAARPSSWRARTLVPLFLLIYCISFANPARVGLMMVAPLYVLDRALAYDRPGQGRGLVAILGLRDPVVMVGFGASFIGAFALYFVLARLGTTQASYNAASLWWGGVPSVWRHLSTFRGWFDYLGAGDSSWEQNPSGFVAIKWFRHLVAWALSAWAVWCVGRIRADAIVPRRAMSLALLVSFAPIFAIYVLLEPLAISGGTLRYFIVSMIIIFVLAAFGLKLIVDRFPAGGPIILAVAALLFVPVAAQRFIPLVAKPASPGLALSEILRDEGLNWGYATWWNAGRTTVMSGGNVRVNPVNITGSGVISPFGNMISTRWYRPSTWVGTTFLALERGELTPVQFDFLRSVLGAPARVVETQGYRVLVYPDNIAEKFSCDFVAPTEHRLAKGQILPFLSEARLEASGSTAMPALNVRVRNPTDGTISGAGRYPMSIGVQLLRADGSVAERDWLHVPLRCPISPGGELSMLVPLRSHNGEASKIRVDLVQEGVAWLKDLGGRTVELPYDGAATGPGERKSTEDRGPR